MIIGNLDFVRSIGHPNKTDSPLIVDPDTVLSSAIPFQLLQAVSCRGHQVFEIGCAIEHRQLPFGHLSEAGKLPYHRAGEELFRLFVPKTSDHGIQTIMILRVT
jgi:hypothetical protein